MLCPGLGILKCPGLDILKYRVINLALTLRQSQSIKLILIETMRGADSSTEDVFSKSESPRCRSLSVHVHRTEPV